MKTKQELRAEFLARRRAIPAAEAARWSAALEARALALPELAGREAVYIYVAMDNEAETRGLIAAFLAQGRRVLAPIVDRDARRLHWGELTTLDDLRAGAHAILEPSVVAHRDTGPHAGVAIVPCVAFTAVGDRLGRGGGYYDRFLASFAGPVVALAYELQRVEALPVEAHDVRVQHVVTESRVYPL